MRNMESKRRNVSSIFSIGVFENIDDDIVPTYASPILVSFNGTMYQRLSYKFQRPYRIDIVGAIGLPSASYRDLFQFPAYEFHDPVRVKLSTFTVVLSRRKILYTRSKLNLVLQIIFWGLLVRRLSYFRNAKRTLTGM